MTVSEFNREITDFSELCDFCDEHRCSYMEDIYDDDGRDRYIESDIEYYLRNEGWRELSDYLYNLSQSSCDWWKRDDYGDWIEADDDVFEEYLSDVLDWAMERGIVVPDEEEQEEQEEAADDEFFGTSGETVTEEEDVAFEDEDCDISEVFASSVNGVKEELNRIEERRREEESRRIEAARVMDEMEFGFSFTEEEDDDLGPLDDFNNLIGELTL